MMNADRCLTCMPINGPLLFGCSLSRFCFGIFALLFHSCSRLRICFGRCCRIHVGSWIMLDLCSLPFNLNFCCRIRLAVFQLLLSRLLSSCTCNILLVLYSKLNLQLAARGCN